MKPTTIRATRINALEEDDLRELSDMSFKGVMDDMAQSERRPYKHPKISRPEIPKPKQPERDLESTHTDQTINEMLAGSFSNDEPHPSSELRMLPGGTMEPETGDATEDLLSPDLLFPELTLK